MTDRSDFDPTYRDELRRWVPALAGFQALTGVCDALPPDLLPAGLKLFAEGNLSKRREKLRAQLEFVAEAFDDFPDLVSAYVDSVPPPANDTTAGDGERFLSWLERTGKLTPRQRDYLACQQARLAVEAAARAARSRHLRFQELWSSTPQPAAESDMARGLRVHLNPCRAGSRFMTPALLDGNATPPTDVLFFVAGEEIRTAVLKPNDQSLVEELASVDLCTLDEWAALSRLADREELVALCGDLVTLGLLALK